MCNLCPFIKKNEIKYYNWFNEQDSRSRAYVACRATIAREVHIDAKKKL